MDARFSLLISELNAQKDEIDKLHGKIKEKLNLFRKNPDNEDVKDSLGYKLHNLYCAYEDLFKIVAGFFENQIDDLPRYHMALPKRMKIEIEGIRPTLISEETFRILNELRAFRHLFRHAYVYELDPARVIELAEKCEGLKELFSRDFQAFLDTLKETSTNF